MERLAQQRYFDLGQPGGADEVSVATAVPMDLSEVSEEVSFDFSRHWTTVKNACMNFGRDRLTSSSKFVALEVASRRTYMLLIVN
jgi:hypothetical protein